VYFCLKFFMMFNFMVSVYLSIKFRVGLSMFALLALNLYYFWKTHTNFIDEAERQYLDQKILKRTASVTQASRTSTRSSSRRKES